MGDRHGLICLLLALALTSAGCKRKNPNETPPPPTDSLAKGESVEGKDKAYALPLPRLAKITWKGENTITVTTNLPPEELVNFVRARVKDGEVVTGTSTTQLRNVVVPSEPARKLTIEIRPAAPLTGSRSEMLVNDTTGKPIEPGLSDEERWKKAGFSPEGKVLDPKQLQ